jgi:hypothetical protein
MADQHSRKLKIITFTIDSIAFECQLTSWKMNNNTEDGEKLFTFCPDGETREEADPDWALDLKFLADWRLDGISDFLTLHDQETAAFVLDHLPDIVGEHVRWAGDLKIKAPSVGGDVRTTELTEVTLPCIGKPVYSRP